jgi:hypothetical protein
VPQYPEIFPYLRKMECGNSDKKKYVTVIITTETESIRDNRGIVKVRVNA